ncbi:2-oxo-4-hydroxy-4-carboxy-5-ureidoimidazoline decarboxylase [Glycomyces sp. NPDC047010]|uniref:2-oxo-4-hydroxy-4-carboxy-5-ureidoimidazoline decarboxylase n=1 Tax=Glycomyces sp. NPDC047010 TaxID=3155023 RepID=UPI0033E45407
MWTLGGFNTADPESATRVLTACCASPAWAERLAAARPYDTLAALTGAALAAFDALDDTEIRRAVDAHPRIGGGAKRPLAVPAGNAGVAADARGRGPARPSGPEAEWSRGEQARAMTAGAAVQAALAEANAAYEHRFGHVFLICATGLAAEDILAAARRRLANDEAAERAETRAELRKIVALRLDKAFGEDR